MRLNEIKKRNHSQAVVSSRAARVHRETLSRKTKRQQNKTKQKMYTNLKTNLKHVYKEDEVGYKYPSIYHCKYSI